MPRTVLTLVVPALSILAAPASAQESKALFHAPLVVLPIDGPPFQRLADFDGDGDLDAIGTRIHGNGGNNQIVIWHNNGGVFTPAWNGSAAMYGPADPTNSMRTLALATADFNVDGQADFVVANGEFVQRFVSAGNGTFTSTGVAVPSVFVFCAATGDFDADGNADHAVIGRNTVTGNLTVKVFLWAGGTPAWTLAGLAGTELRLGVAELDGQAGADLLVFDRGSPTARVLALDNGQLVVRHVLPSSTTTPTTMWKWIAGDVDADQDADIVVFHPGTGAAVANYQIFRRTSPTTLVAEPQADGGPSEYLADIDGDGDLDGVCCGGGGGPTYSWPTLDFPSMFQIAENRGGGNFAFSWNFRGAGSLSMAGTGDVDGDGDVDFVAGRCVCYGRGPWTEHPMPTAGGTNATIVGRRHDLGDVDRDGDPDFLGVRNRGDGAMAVFNDSVAPPPGKQFGASIRIDVDGDGAPDRIHRQMQGGQFEFMVLLKNNGGGHYSYSGACAPPGLVFGGTYAYTADHYLAADCDGDGDEDLIANSNPANGEGYSAQIFWNTNGAFSAGPSFNQFTGGRIDAVADFDNDGLPDLLMSNGTTSVARGTGNAGAPFAFAWSGPARPFEPNALVVADLDDDGRTDFAAPAGPLSELTLFVNYTQPGGPFGFADHALPGIKVTMAPLGGGATVRSTVAAADFDGDGMTDLALARTPGEPGVGTILRRISWSNPPSLANYEVTKQVFVDGFAGDADGDGDVDLIGELVVRNPMHHGGAAGYRLQSLAGLPGEGGATPVLGATGPFRGGETEVLRLTGVPGPTVTLLCMSLGQANVVDFPLTGLTCYIDPGLAAAAALTIDGDGQGRAAASATWPIPVPYGLQGITFFLQAFVLDLSIPTIATQTNLLTKRIGA